MWGCGIQWFQYWKERGRPVRGVMCECVMCECVMYEGVM